MGWRGWIEESFSRRVAAQAVLSLLFASLLLCVIAFAGSLWLLRQQQDRDLKHRLDHMAERLAARIEVFVRNSADLATNPVMTTSLLDSHERDTYLKPFLGSYRLPVTEPHAIALCDVHGRPLVGRNGRTPECYADLPQMAALFATEAAQTVILWREDGAPRLLTLQPVQYPGTGHAEGYVAASLDVSSVLANLAGESAGSLRLMADPDGVAAPSAGGDLTSAERAVALGDVAGRFRLSLTERRTMPEGFGLVVTAYLLAVVAAVLLSWILARRMGQRLTMPLVELSNTARRIAEEGATSRMAPVEGRDEIAMLAVAFNTMLATLQRSRGHLEVQVADRTRALNEALADVQRSEERYRSLFSGSKVAMLLIDPDDDSIVDANRMAAAYYGWDVDTLKTMSMSRINTASPDDVAVEMARATQEGRDYLFFRHRLASGEIRDVEVHSGPVASDSKTLLLSLIHDVTDRIRLERERQRLATAIEQSPVSVVVTSPDGTIDYVNAAFSRVTGYSRDEAIGQNPRLLKSGETTEEEYQAIWAQLAGGQPWSGTFRNLRKDGSAYWEQARIFPIMDETGTLSHYVGIKEDITERKHAEEVIQTLNRSYQDVLSAASEVAIIATAPDGIITVFNRGAEKMLGYSAWEVVGTETPALFHIAEEIDARATELDAELTIPVRGFATFIRKAELEGSEKREWTYRRKDGGHITVSLVVTPVYSSPDEITGYLGVAIDITERRNVEHRLTESEQRFRTLVEGTTDWVWETDDQHRFSWFSPSFDIILGQPATVQLGKRRWDVASERHEIDVEIWQAHMEDLSARRSFRDFRYWLRLADGNAKWISISGSPRFDDSGNFLGYRGIGTDITFEAASALRLKMLSTVVEQSPVSVVITNPDGVIEYVNAHFTTITGYTAHEAIGQRASLISSGETPYSTYAELWATITDGRQWRGEFKNRKKNGVFHWEVVAISPVINDAQQIVHYVSVKEDITFRKEAETRISEANQALELQAQQLQTVNAELEQFAYVASHDLRQPLRMVTSYLALIERRLGGELNEDLRTFFDFAINGARRMDRLILDLLEYSRTGRCNIPFAPVRLADTLADSLANLEVAVAEAGAVVTIAEDLPTVLGERLDLTRLFQNLIGNAIKYRAPERAPRVGVTCCVEDGEWIVTVCDNGIGIAPADRDRAFKIFQRLVANGAYEGTGIGLAVCKKIVENHGGRIWIEDGQTEGTCFRFTLPMTGQPVQESSDASSLESIDV